ncbi:hypothetical protein WISP_90639 [Willisornis vidua]|uniref:C2H2-type domain-containing protein n=1 Tax=Willisornis vidua TaxID=1566151 RepID=A0ABQ9D1Z6_9PASS|nr:hypothetical protein WISP_90639 [Willisornis vidua]
MLASTLQKGMLKFHTIVAINFYPNPSSDSFNNEYLLRATDTTTGTPAISTTTTVEIRKSSVMTTEITSKVEKIPTTATSSTTCPSVETEEEKAKRLLYCSLCKVAVNSASQLEAHNSGSVEVRKYEKIIDYTGSRVELITAKNHGRNMGCTKDHSNCKIPFLFIIEFPKVTLL